MMEKVGPTLLLVLISFHLTSFCQNQNWQNVNLPYQEKLISLYSYDSQQAFATSNNKLYYSSDNGLHWSTKDTLQLVLPPANSRLKILGFKQDTIILKGYKGQARIFKMNVNDSVMRIDTSLNNVATLNQVRFYKNGFIGLDSNRLLVKITNSVKTILHPLVFSSQAIYSLKDSNIAIPNFSDLYISDNLGFSWDTIDTRNFTTNNPSEVHYNGSDTIYLRKGGIPSIEEVTYNKGLSWYRLDSGSTTRRPFGFTFTPNPNEVIGNYRNIYLYSNDGGRNFFSDSIYGNLLQGNHYYTYLNNWGTVFVYGEIGLVSITSNYRLSTQINEFSAFSKELNIIPNPVNESFKIVAKNCNMIKETIIIDANGSLIKAIQNPCEAIYVNDLKAGLYFLKSNYNNQQFIKKFIIR